MLHDEKSKQVFMKRCEYERNGYIKEIFYELMEFPEGYVNLISRLSTTKYALYGAGGACNMLILRLKSANVLANCVGIFDYKAVTGEKSIQNVPVIPPREDLLADERLYIVMAISEKNNASVFQSAIDYLYNAGVNSERIIRPYYDVFGCDKVYFDEKIIISQLCGEEVFIDGGSYDFYDSKRFIQHCESVGAIPKKIFAFEPDPKNFAKVKENAKQFGDTVVAYNAGLWSSDISLHFKSERIGTSSAIDENGETEIIGISFDNLAVQDKVSFVKMDIEGAEIEALKGMEGTLKRNRPKLAISIYHKSEDYLDIPEYLHSIIPDYKFYIRFYSWGGSDMVLYCV